MFVDRVTVKLFAGNGGAGAATFRHEPFVPLGGPDGGDGGKGGDIVFVADTNKSTLLDLRYHRNIRAENGERGKSKKMHGADGEGVIVKVPQGTIVKDLATGRMIADLTGANQSEIIAHGGRGGRGNFRFKTARNPAPEFSEQGELGDVLEVEVELKLLADVGLVGYPSVGKSTVLSVASVAKPKIGDYDFTTLVPQLGVVKVNREVSFVMADLPGLIRGASEGKGLGIEFLRHIERCRVILHVIDMAGSSGRDPLQDYEDIRKELGQYKYRLLERPEVVLAIKMDLDGASENLERFRKAHPDLPVYGASAIINEGLEGALKKCAELLQVTAPFPLEEEITRASGVVYTYEPPKKPFTVTKIAKGKWNVQGPRIDQLFHDNPLKTEEDIRRLSHDLKVFGIEHQLREKGAEDGDLIYIRDYEFTFEDF